MAADIIHHGHINIIKVAQSYGDVTIGLLTDEAIESYKRTPIVKYNDRLNVIKYIKGVDNVIPQHTLDYTSNLELLKPDFVVHGDDWKSGTQKATRDRVEYKLKEWGGKVIDVPYTKGISSSEIINVIKST